MASRTYTVEQQRVADYISKLTGGAVGGGEDPVGFLIASHSALSASWSIAPLRATGDAKTRDEDRIFHATERVVGSLIHGCDGADLVVDVRIEVRRKDGTRVVLLDGHGKHELEG
jgi:hypothetical protein